MQWESLVVEAEDADPDILPRRRAQNRLFLMIGPPSWAPKSRMS
jgi:hypothetical protein